MLPILGNGELLPESWQFLRWGWWVVHLVAIPLVFFIGFLVGKRKGGKAGSVGQAE